MNGIRKSIIKYAKKILGIQQNQSLSFVNFWKNLRQVVGPYIWKEKITVEDLISTMQSLGMKKGSNVFIHCNWNEFYNFIGTERDLISAILNVIGEEGTLIMPAFPLKRKGKIFDVKKSITAAGLLAEEFRKFPGVKRSINIQHSVCALGPESDYLLSEHHLSETCWDERSPYYKLKNINALVFGFGLGRYYIGTMVHCVGSILRKELPYFSDFYESEKTVHNYIDYDGCVKTYACYEFKSNLVRSNRWRGGRTFCKKYFESSDHSYSQISNLVVSVSRAERVIPRMIDLGRRGVVFYAKPSRKGYKFQD